MNLLDAWVEWKLRRQWWFSKEEMALWGITAQSPEKVHEYLSIRAYKALRMYIEDMPWHPIVDNKWISKHFFAAHGISMPETYGLVHPVYGRDREGQPLQNAAQFMAWLDRRGLERFVFKHIGELKGNAVHVVEGVERDTAGSASGVRLVTGESLDATVLGRIFDEKRLGVTGYLLEERLQAHPEVNELTGGGLSSIRINTLCHKEHSGVQFAFIRLGRVGAATDHGIRGGIYAPVDPASGIIQAARVFDHSGATQGIDQHPDSGCKLAGRKVPEWEGIVELAIRAGRACTGIPCIGWDIVPSSEGPKLIEGNVSWSMTGLQGVIGGLLANGVAADWREHLGANLPDGSLRWRLKHWNKCRRLNVWERWLTDIGALFGR